MTDVLTVSAREAVGSRPVRRLRKVGQTPAILYGHGQANVNLAISTSEVTAAIRHGQKVVDLQGAVSQKALIRDVQWDSFGMHVLHVDLTRVSAQERVTVAVGLDLKGESPGAKQGGIVEHLVFEVEIECSASDIPDRLHASINNLELGSTVTVGDVELPENVTLVTSPDMVVAHCLTPGPAEEEEAEEAAAPTSAEPEVIGRKAESEEEDSD